MICWNHDSVVRIEQKILRPIKVTTDSVIEQYSVIRSRIIIIGTHDTGNRTQSGPD